MRDYATSLGFEFDTGWARLLAVEKGLTLINPDQPWTKLTQKDYDVMDRLAMPMLDAVEVAKKQKLTSCRWLEEFLVLDVLGNVSLCCGATGQPSNRIGKFLDLPFAEIQSRKRKHALCGPCLENSIPALLVGDDPDYDRFGDANRETRQLAKI